MLSIWKDSNHPEGSENHFGLITLNGQAKYALWDLVDSGAFEGLTRGGVEITKSFEGRRAFKQFIQIQTHGITHFYQNLKKRLVAQFL